MSSPTAQLLYHVLVPFLKIGTLFSLAVGIGILLAPLRMEKANVWFSRWISTVHWQQHINRPRKIERWVYRHHRGVGLIVLAFGLAFPFVMIATGGIVAWTGAWSQILPSHEMAAWLSESLWWIGWLGSALCAAIGLALFFRPSALRELEAWANRWIDLDRYARRLDIAHYDLDRFLWRHQRLVAIFVVACSLYNLVALWRLP
ncbi:MAG: hypothetical protein ACYC2R_03860 [Burkholderiales bacterium]